MRAQFITGSYVVAAADLLRREDVDPASVGRDATRLDGSPASRLVLYTGVASSRMGSTMRHDSST